MSNGNYTSLAIMTGELRTITVHLEDADSLVVHAKPGTMAARAASALRAAFPAAQIEETGSPTAAIVHVVQQSPAVPSDLMSSEAG